MEPKHTDKAPFFKTWNHWYILLVLSLLLLIVLFALFTKRFA